MESILTKPPANKTSRPDLGGLFVIGWRDTSHESALRWVWLNPMVIDTVQDEFIASADITFHAPTRVHLHVGVLDYFPFCHQPTYQPEGHLVKPDGIKPASPSLGWDRAQIMPTGFLPNPVSPTQRPSCQTRWKKTSFALARLRPSSDHADGLLIESRLANPTAIGSNPMEENQSKIPKSPMYIYYIWYIYSYNRYYIYNIL